jgi:phosphotransferase system HPr (HPr) family protein
MNTLFVEKRVTIINPQGLHARPADLFVRLAQRFQADVQVAKDNQFVDGKSILSILTLAAERGTELTIGATGPDANEALAALAELVESGFVEDAQGGPQLASEH